MTVAPYGLTTTTVTINVSALRLGLMEMHRSSSCRDWSAADEIARAIPDLDRMNRHAAIHLSLPGSWLQRLEECLGQHLARA